MSLAILKNDIESHDFKKIYYICGEEAYLKHFYFTELKKALFGEITDHPDCMTREGSELSLSELTDAVNAYPMMAERKAVIIIDLKSSDIAASWLSSHAKELEDNIIIIIYQLSENIDLKTSVGKQLKKSISDNGLWVDIDPLDTATLKKWVLQQFKKRNKSMESDCINYFLSQTSNDMYSLLNEVEKLSSYCDAVITKDAIDLITTKTIDAKTYELTDAIFEKNSSKAFSVLKKLSDMRTNEIMIMASVYSAVTTVYKTKLLASSGLSTHEMELELGQKGFVLNRNLARANKTERSSLEKMLTICAEVDVASKSTSADSEALLSELITSLIGLV